MLLTLLLLAGCAPTGKAPPDPPAGAGDSADPPDTAPPDDTAPEETGQPEDTGEAEDSADSAETADPGPPECPSGMVAIPDAEAPAYCIDAYEATAEGDLGNADQGEAYPDGSTAATAEAIGGVVPTTQLSW